MKNYIQEGKVVNHTVTGAAVVAGQGLKVLNTFGVCVNSAAIGEVVPLSTEGVYELPKDASVVTGLGQDIFWDDTAKKATITQAANIKIGHATEAAATGAATVKVKIAPIKYGTSAANQAANATANGSDLATTQALANSLKFDLNALLAKLKAAGIMIAD